MVANNEVESSTQNSVEQRIRLRQEKIINRFKISKAERAEVEAEISQNHDFLSEQLSTVEKLSKNIYEMKCLLEEALWSLHETYPTSQIVDAVTALKVYYEKTNDYNIRYLLCELIDLHHIYSDIEKAVYCLEDMSLDCSSIEAQEIHQKREETVGEALVQH